MHLTKRTPTRYKGVMRKHHAKELLADIESHLEKTGISEFNFGYESVKNGRLIERLRKGGRVWPETEDEIRGYMEKANAEHDRRRPT